MNSPLAIAVVLASQSLVAQGLMAQAPGVPAAPPPPPAPVYRAAIDLTAAASPGALEVEIPTNVGPMKASLPIKRFDVRGIDGRARFALELWLDPARADTGDPVLDALIAQQLLPIEKLRITSSDRVAPSRDEAASADERELFGAGISIDAGARPRYRVVRYRFDVDATGGGALQVVHKATLEQLGVKDLPHPFIKVTGPTTVRLQVPLVPKT